MKTKTTFAISFLALAAWCPAPIKDIQSKYHELPAHSQAQIAEEMRLNGSQGVVGSVPVKTMENGTPVEATQGDADAKGVVAEVAPVVSDPVASRVVSEAGKSVDAGSQGQSRPWFMGILVFGIGFGLFQAFRVGLDRYVPGP